MPKCYPAAARSGSDDRDKIQLLILHPATDNKSIAVSPDHPKKCYNRHGKPGRRSQAETGSPRKMHILYFHQHFSTPEGTTATVLLFSSGRMVFTGATTLESLEMITDATAHLLASAGDGIFIS